MASRIAAFTILIAGLAALAWVALGGSATDSTTISQSTGAGEQPALSSAPDRDEADAAGAAETASDSAPRDGETSAADATPTSDEPPPAAPAEEVDPPENFGPRMDLVNLDGWLNTEATSLDEFNGQVLLIEMWTFGCHNCKARIPFNQSYQEEFGDQNFEIIGVHAPEFSYEAEVPNIVEAAERLGVDWPIALDTNKKNFRAWQPGSTNFWPRTYVIDQNGDIRYDHIGEGKYEELRETIRYLVENPPAPKAS